MTDTLADRTRTPATTADSLVVRLVSELARVRGVDPVDLPPLYEYVDVEALCALFQPSAGDTSSVGSVTFHVDDHVVQVAQNGNVDVSAAEDRSRIDSGVSS